MISKRTFLTSVLILAGTFPEVQSQTRFRNFSIETVGGRVVMLENGAEAQFHSGGRFVFRHINGRENEGTWKVNSAIFGNSTSVHVSYKNGRSVDFFILDEKGTLYWMLQSSGRQNDQRWKIVNVKML